jgi:hypothetical protein
MAADRDLLFGLVALQNGLINQGQLMAAFQAWTLDKARHPGRPPRRSRRPRWRRPIRRRGPRGTPHQETRRRRGAEPRPDPGGPFDPRLVDLLARGLTRIRRSLTPSPRCGDWGRRIDACALRSDTPTRPPGLPRVRSWLGQLSCSNTCSQLNGRHPRPVNAYALRWPAITGDPTDRPRWARRPSCSRTRNRSRDSSRSVGTGGG